MERKEFAVRDTFGIEAPAEITVTGRAARGPFVPAVDPAYQFRRELLSDLLAWVKVGGRDGLFLYGPTGAGKSSLVCQVAARLHIPVQRVTAHGRLEVQDLIGHHTLIDGDMVFVDGPLTTALRNGQWFLLDELDLLDPATAAGLNGIAEGAPLVIPENGGEIVEAHPDFRFLATGNTAGAGDGTGLYQGTLRQNLAFMDRFWVLEVGYPTEEQERAILAAAVPDLPEIIRQRMVSVANQVRKLFMCSPKVEGQDVAARNLLPDHGAAAGGSLRGEEPRLGRRVPGGGRRGLPLSLEREGGARWACLTSTAFGPNRVRATAIRFPHPPTGAATRKPMLR